MRVPYIILICKYWVTNWIKREKPCEMGVKVFSVCKIVTNYLFKRVYNRVSEKKLQTVKFRAMVVTWAECLE